MTRVNLAYILQGPNPIFEGAKPTETAVVTPSAARYYRRALGLTQTVLAKAAGVSISYVKQFESERLRPSSGFLSKISAFFISKDIPAEKLAVEYSTVGELDAAPRVREGRMCGMATIPQIRAPKTTPRDYTFDDATPADVKQAAIDSLREIEADLVMKFNQKVERIGDMEGFLEGTTSDLTPDTMAALQEAYKAMAKWCVTIRMLCGWRGLDVKVGNKDQEIIGDVIESEFLEHLVEVGFIGKKPGTNDGKNPEPEENSDDSPLPVPAEGDKKVDPHDIIGNL